jgi:hypothetical protein
MMRKDKLLKLVYLWKNSFQIKIHKPITIIVFVNEICFFKTKLLTYDLRHKNMALWHKRKSYSKYKP